MILSSAGRQPASIPPSFLPAGRERVYLRVLAPKKGPANRESLPAIKIHLHLLPHSNLASFPYQYGGVAGAPTVAVPINQLPKRAGSVRTPQPLWDRLARFRLAPPRWKWELELCTSTTSTSGTNIPALPLTGRSAQNPQPTEWQAPSPSQRVRP